MLCFKVKQRKFCDWQHPCLILSSYRKNAALFLCISSPGYQWYDALCCLPAGSVWLSSTLQLFKDVEASCNGCFACQCLSSVISLDSSMSSIVHQQVLVDWHCTLSHSTLDYPLQLFLFLWFNESLRLITSFVNQSTRFSSPSRLCRFILNTFFTPHKFSEP